MLKILTLLFGLSGEASAAATYVVDGDTIKLDGVTYRINGIDAPEAAQTCTSSKGKSWDCGNAATKALTEITLNKSVRCQSLGLDSYDRHIGRCFVGETDIARAMVKRGMAWAFLKFSDEYEADQIKAKRQKVGIWQGAAQPAWEYRSDKWAAAVQTAPAGCPIKGNITAKGRIYHPPWSRWYNRTRINTSKGERWFCNEAEAVKAGWRAPRSN